MNSPLSPVSRLSSTVHRPPSTVHRLPSIVFFLLSIIVLLSSCLSLRPVAKKVTSQLLLYNPGKVILHPQYRVYHSSETESMVFFKLLTSEVVFNQANPQVKNQAKLRVIYTLYSSLANNEVAQRDTQQFFIDKESVTDQILGSIKV
ncbi:MAG: hypothetical protein WCW62_09355, partial [Bacteroidales bacterium]